MDGAAGRGNQLALRLYADYPQQPVPENLWPGLANCAFDELGGDMQPD